MRGTQGQEEGTEEQSGVHHQLLRGQQGTQRTAGHSAADRQTRDGKAETRSSFAERRKEVSSPLRTQAWVRAHSSEASSYTVCPQLTQKERQTEGLKEPLQTKRERKMYVYSKIMKMNMKLG